MVTASVQRLTISWPAARVSFRGEVELTSSLRRASLARVSDPSIDPESPYDSAAVAPDDGGDPKVVDRWLFRRALVGRWKSIGGALANRSSSRPPTPLQGRCKNLAWDHARGCAVVLWSTAFDARPHHKQWVWPPRSCANKSPPRIAVENLLLAVANTCATATAPRLKMLKTRHLETTWKLSSWVEVVLFSSDSGRPCPGPWGLVLPLERLWGVRNSPGRWRFVG